MRRYDVIGHDGGLVQLQVQEDPALELGSRSDACLVWSLLAVVVFIGNFQGFRLSILTFGKIITRYSYLTILVIKPLMRMIISIYVIKY